MSKFVIWQHDLAGIRSMQAFLKKAIYTPCRRVFSGSAGLF